MMLVRIAIFMSAACMVLLTNPAAEAEECAIARHHTERMEAHLAYPQFGHARVDAALARFAAQELEQRTQDMLRELGGTASGQDKPVSLKGHYTLFRPSPRAVSVLFELRATSPRWSAPRHYCATRSYRLPSGEELGLAEVFKNVPEALKILARQCSPKLLAQLLEQHTQERLEMTWFLRTRLIAPGYPMPDGADIAEFSRRGGDAPAMRLLESVVRATRAEAENYQHFVLTPRGLRIQFEALQPGGPEAVAPHVELSLQELRQANPHLELWGK